MTAARILGFAGATPEAADDSWLAPGATLVGRVRLDADASVWFGAVLRADGDQIVVGAGSNIQDGCVLHADPGLPVTIGSRVTVGHGAILHGCTVEDDVLIGMGAVLLNGAVVRSGSIVAAGALVPEGSVVESDCLVAGVPMKVRRATTPAEREQTRRNAQSYVDLTSRYRRAAG